MKLKFVQSINEADAARGQRILKLQEINNVIKNAVEDAGYKFKDQADKGFYILPRFGYVSKISIDIIKDKNEYVVKVFDARGEERQELTKKISGNDFNKSMQEDIAPSALNLIFKIGAADIATLEKGVSEATLPKFLQTAIKKIKGNIGDVKTSLDKKAANKAEKRTVKGLANQCETIIKDEIAKRSEITRELTIKTEIKENHIDIFINGDVVAGVGYKTDYAAADKRFLVTSCITAVSEAKGIKNCSLASFITFLNRKLLLNIKLTDAAMLSLTGSDDAEITKVNNFETILKNTLGDEILSKLAEGLNEAIIDNDVQKYDDALAFVKTAAQGEALVKLYFYKKSGNKLQLTDNEAKELWKAVSASKSFAKNKSVLVNLFVNYWNKNQSSPDIAEELKNLITLLTTDKFINKLGKVDYNKSIIYNKAFVGTAAPTADKHRIYDKYKDILDQNITIDSNAKKLEIERAANIKLPKLAELTTAESIANFMVFTDHKAKEGLRNIKQVNAIYNALDDIYIPRPNAKQKANSAVPELIGLEKRDVDLIKGVFNIDSTGTQAADDLLNNIKKSSKAQKILTQLLQRLK